MTTTDTQVRARGGRMHMRRSRGAVSGLLLVLLGLWGALIPFVGPYFNFAFTPDQPWAWTAGRGWLMVLPGALTVLGGLILLMSRNRATAMFGGWLAVISGAWFIVGRAFAGPLGLGDAGAPVAATETGRLWLEMAFFYAPGALIIFLGAAAIGRLSVRSVRDVEFAEDYGRRPMATTAAHPQRTVSDEPTPATDQRRTEQPAMATSDTAVTDRPATDTAGTDRAETDRAVTDRPATDRAATSKRRPWSNLFGRRHTTAH